MKKLGCLLLLSALLLTLCFAVPVVHAEETYTWKRIYSSASGTIEDGFQVMHRTINETKADGEQNYADVYCALEVPPESFPADQELSLRFRLYGDVRRNDRGRGIYESCAIKVAEPGLDRDATLNAGYSMTPEDYNALSWGNYTTGGFSDRETTVTYRMYSSGYSAGDEMSIYFRTSFGQSEWRYRLEKEGNSQSGGGHDGGSSGGGSYVKIPGVDDKGVPYVTPRGTIIACTEALSAEYGPKRLMDGDESTFYRTASTDIYVIWKTEKPFCVSGYSLAIGYKDREVTPRRWELYGSARKLGRRDGGWEKLFERNIDDPYHTGSSSSGSSFFPAYRYFKLEVSGNFGGEYTQLAEVSLSGKEAVDLSKSTVTAKDQTYTGGKLAPSVKVKLGRKTLKAGEDYTVSFKNNRKIGTATVTVTGAGGYYGTAKGAFAINPKKVSGLKLTAGVRQFSASWNRDKAVTGYELQYGLKKDFSDAKTKTVKKNGTVKATLKKLEAKKTYYVRIRAYKKVSGKTYYSGWTKGKVKTKK